ncbi:uncharacterized protein LOC132715165 isoform X2 [Ruditapes philippinarum]|nr:uncharacterized protein LOC132715165 isoform X2 [Ruditapes philippinarum]
MFDRSTSNGSGWTGVWVIDSTCHCCHTYCKEQALSEAYNLTNGNCTEGNLCCTSGQSPTQWTPYCAAKVMPFTVNCSYIPRTCTINAYDYYCTCQQNFGQMATCATSPPPSPPPPLMYIAFTALLPLIAILIYGFHKYIIYRSKTKLHKDSSQGENAPVNTIYVKCNIMLVVGDRDELKVVSNQLEMALKSLPIAKNLLKVTRVSLFHLFVDNYKIECDKAVFLLDAVANSTDSRVNTCTEKLMFTRRQSKNSVAIVNFHKTEEDVKEINETDHAFSFSSPRRENNIEEIRDTHVYEICSASNIRELGEWFPFVMRITFNIDNRCACIGRLILPEMFFSLGTLFKGNETTENFKQLLLHILTSCGAHESRSETEERIKCKIFVVKSFREEQIWDKIQGIHDVYIFSESNVRPVVDESLYKTALLYCKDEMMSGILEVLHILRII